MSRKFKRQGGGPKPDYRYKSGLVTEFINNLVRQGKKRTAENIFYTALDIIGQKTTEEDPLTVFKKAVDNVKPTLEVKSRRIGGANYQVPVEVAPERKASLAIRWIIAYTKERSEKSMAEKLAAELLQAYKNEGASVRKKIDTHKMAEANKAFAHFRW
jgi:small subunit ribosomal protein S7